MSEQQSKTGQTGQEEEFNPCAQPTGHAREEPETERKKGCRRWGCGCLAVSALCLWAAIQIPDFLAYKERQEWQTVPEESLRGVCGHGWRTSLQSAVVGEATYSGFRPVYGCREPRDYHALAKIELRHYRRAQTEAAAEAAREERERFKRRFDDLAAKGECRAMPAGARVGVLECRPYAPYAAQVHLEGESAPWWVACSGLKKP